MSVLSLQHFSFHIFSTVYFRVLLLAPLLSNLVTVGKMTHGLRIAIVSSPANGGVVSPAVSLKSIFVGIRKMAVV